MKSFSIDKKPYRKIILKIRLNISFQITHDSTFFFLTINFFKKCDICPYNRGTHVNSLKSGFAEVFFMEFLNVSFCPMDFLNLFLLFFFFYFLKLKKNFFRLFLLVGG